LGSGPLDPTVLLAAVLPVLGFPVLPPGLGPPFINLNIKD